MAVMSLPRKPLASPTLRAPSRVSPLLPSLTPRDLLHEEEHNHDHGTPYVPQTQRTPYFEYLTSVAELVSPFIIIPTDAFGNLYLLILKHNHHRQSGLMKMRFSEV